MSAPVPGPSAAPGPGAQPWRGGRDVDPSEALRLLRRRLPGLGAVSVELLGVGWDNTAYLVDGTWLARFPRRQQGADLTDRELLVLPRLADLLSLAVPAPVLVGDPDPGSDQGAGPDTDGFPWRVTVARAVPGVEWWRDPPAGEAAVAAAGRVAGALAVLHSATVQELFGDALEGLPVDPNRRSEPVERLRRGRAAHDRLTAAGLLGPELSGPALAALAERADGSPRGPQVLVHGDLHVRHVLVAAGVPTGLIDWGDVCRAEASVDLQVAYALVEGEARGAFLRRYGPVAPGVLDRARLLAVSLHLMLTDSALDVGDRPLLAAALAAAHRAVRP